MADGLAAADRVVAPSAAYARNIARHYALPCAPLVVHNSRTMPRATATAPLHSSALTVGRLWDPVKNAALLDGVAARLAIPFDAAGAARGPHGEAVSLDHLHLLGELATQALAVRLAERPVYVSAATFEPFGLAVLEAAAAGCALVLSDIATFRELWDGVAIFVPATEATAYADAIEAVVGDMALRRRMGDEARERAAQYTPAKTAGEMLNVYASALRDRAPRKRAAA
jgi:glycosyltransferase involved in cell wall biosynthesis